jgi:hypothetical protein
MTHLLHGVRFLDAVVVHLPPPMGVTEKHTFAFLRTDTDFAKLCAEDSGVPEGGEPVTVRKNRKFKVGDARLPILKWKNL